MNNFVAYFYDMTVDKMTFYNDHYSFNYLGYSYRLYLTDNDLDINKLVTINRLLLNNTLVSEIIANKYGKYMSSYNDSNYILIKIYVNTNQKISLKDITYLANILHSNKTKIDWATLWSDKIDYLEKLISENGKKYPLLVDSFNYFVGLAENAISYYNNINAKNSNYVISHKSIKYNDTIENLYNPLNIIFDYSVRDVAEYIKNAFWVNNIKIYDELQEYMKHNYLSNEDVKLMISRMLYPSFYFELYEDILLYNQDESIIIFFTQRLPQYEKYLANIIAFFRNYYDITEITWLRRKNED